MGICQEDPKVFEIDVMFLAMKMDDHPIGIPKGFDHCTI